VRVSYTRNGAVSLAYRVIGDSPDPILG